MKNIAIIGSGIASLAAAHYLSPNHKITIYEALDSPGGHIDTHEVGDIKLDTGFVLFNEKFYVNFLTLLEELKIDYQPSIPSFSLVKHETMEALHNESWWNTVAPQFIDQSKFKHQLKFFFTHVKKDISTMSTRLLLHDYICKDLDLPIEFLEKAILPLASAAWSKKANIMGAYQAKPVLSFLEQHGFLDFKQSFKWLCVPGGYDQYVKAIYAHPNIDLKLNTPVTSVDLADSNVKVLANSKTTTHDIVIIGCSPDNALKMIASPTILQTKTLSAFNCHFNHGILHTDKSVIGTKNKDKWGALTAHIVSGNNDCLTSYLNPLQNLKTETDYFFTLNSTLDIDPKKIIKKIKYKHVSLNDAAYEAQKSFKTLNQQSNIKFVGAYWGKAYHEDAVVSAKKVVKIIQA